VEGLAFDAAANRLMLACKGKAGKDDRFKRKRAVFAFDLETEKLADEPVFLIDRDEIQRWADSGKGGLTEKLAEFFEPSLADDAFAPSGIAIHPLTKEIFIVSSVGKIVVVLNPTGDIVHLEPLDPELHRQPEGICFDRDGTLFIANEGKGGTAKIFRFSMN
jgi:DNA-binding beta-propeller fold protein YncE